MSGNHSGRDFFNRYVDEIFPDRMARGTVKGRWPGDEWASPTLQSDTYSAFFADAEVGSWRRVVEIGPGSGKYTEMLLDASPCAVRAYDISDRFLAVLRERCARHVASERLSAHLIDWESNRGLVQDLELAGWRRSVDAFFGMDVFIHVDLQSLIVHLMTAALVLRPGGRLMGTFANPLTETGLAKLFADTGRFPAFRSVPSSRFHWVSDATLAAILERIGFRIDKRIDGGAAGLDGARTYLTATLIEEGRSADLFEMMG